MIGRNHGKTVVVGKPSEIGDLEICRGESAVRLVGDIEKMQTRMLVVFVGDTRVVFFFFLFFFSFGFGIGRQECDGFAVG